MVRIGIIRRTALLAAVSSLVAIQPAPARQETLHPLPPVGTMQGERGARMRLEAQHAEFVLPAGWRALSPQVVAALSAQARVMLRKETLSFDYIGAASPGEPELSPEPSGVIAMRLPYGVQADQADARRALSFIDPDETLEVDIKPAADAMLAQLQAGGLKFNDHWQEDFVLGNIKARQRMIAQYATAGTTGGLVVGTDHAAKAAIWRLRSAPSVMKALIMRNQSSGASGARKVGTLPPISRNTGRSLAITGTPRVRASTTGKPKPSAREGANSARAALTC